MDEPNQPINPLVAIRSKMRLCRRDFAVWAGIDENTAGRVEKGMSRHLSARIRAVIERAGGNPDLAEEQYQKWRDARVRSLTPPPQK